MGQVAKLALRSRKERETQQQPAPPAGQPSGRLLLTKYNHHIHHHASNFKPPNKPKGDLSFSWFAFLAGQRQ